MYDKFRTLTGSENIEALSVIRDVTEQVLPDPERRPSAIPLEPVKERVKEDNSVDNLTSAVAGLDSDSD